MNDIGDTQLGSFIALSPIQRGAIVAFVSDFAASVEPGAQVLDAGAGEAPYRSLFAHCSYFTQDWPGSVHETSRPIDFVCDLHDPLPIKSASFDAIVLTEVLEHVANPTRVLTELRRILRPGGRIAITVPFVGALHEEPHDYRRPTSHGLAALLNQAGFAELHMKPLTGWFSTLAHVLRDQGLATQAPGKKARLGHRAISIAFLLASQVLRRCAPFLDRRFDKRHALPLGWTVTARVN
jgi:SAM-dependent methyltransferase